VLVAAGTAGAPNGRGQKRDNTKQTTLFGLPAVPVPAPERPEKRSRKKGGAAVPSEDSRVAEPETMESSQDVEMAELQDVAATQTSQGATATAVDSQQESQATTEVITTQVKRVSPAHAVLKLTNDVQEDGSPEPIDWPATPPPMENSLPDEICTN
jgi:hypothetical protein